MKNLDNGHKILLSAIAVQTILLGALVVGAAPKPVVVHDVMTKVVMVTPTLAATPSAALRRVFVVPTVRAIR